MKNGYAEQHDPLAGSVLFQGIFESRMARPHQPVEPASVRPAPRKAGKIAKRGSIKMASREPTSARTPILSCTCRMRGSPPWPDFSTGSPSDSQLVRPPSTTARFSKPLDPRIRDACSARFPPRQRRLKCSVLSSFPQSSSKRSSWMCSDPGTCFSANSTSVRTSSKVLAPFEVSSPG